MIDTYKMILWTRAKEDSIDSQVDQLFNILMALNKVNYLMPKYQTVRRKKDAVEFVLTKENVRNLIITKKDKKFSDLGSLISFFTSLNDKNSAGISISIGVSNPKFINNITIDLNWDYKHLELEKYDELELLFKDLIAQFNPFYGCVVSRSSREKYDEYYDDISNKPCSIFDMNFWGNEIVENLKIDEEIASKVYEYKQINDGYFIRLSKEPLDMLDTNHMELQQGINKLIGLHI